MSGRDEFEELQALTEYAFPLPLDSTGFHSLMEYVAYEGSLEVEYSLGIEGRIGDRFAEAHRPLRKIEYPAELHATFRFPSEVFAGLVPLRFNKDLGSREGFTSARFEFLKDRLSEVDAKEQATVRNIRSLFDAYFKVVAEWEED